MSTAKKRPRKTCQFGERTNFQIKTRSAVRNKTSKVIAVECSSGGAANPNSNCQSQSNGSRASSQSLITNVDCEICYDILVKPIRLVCSHVFCTYCAKKWILCKGTCPTCRRVLGCNTEMKLIDDSVILSALAARIVSMEKPERQEYTDKILQHKEAVKALRPTEHSKSLANTLELLGAEDTRQFFNTNSTDPTSTTHLTRSTRKRQRSTQPHSPVPIPSSFIIQLK